MEFLIKKLLILGDFSKCKIVCEKIPILLIRILVNKDPDISLTVEMCGKPRF